MGGITAWRPRWLRLTGTGRAAVIGAGALAVTGTAAVFLAIWSHQPWPPVMASVVILMPGLYLAWKAIPAQGRPARGRRAGAWNPVDLGVHQVTGGGRLPPYIRRPHDDVLDALLDPGVAASRLVVVRGGSSTGKSRAAFEVVARGRLDRWRLDYAREEDALEALLDAGIRPRTVLWLGELRYYTSGEERGAAVLGQLARLLEDQDRVIAITTMWPDHWNGYIEAARTGPGLTQDPAGTAGRLLASLPDLTGHAPSDVTPARGGVIEIPAFFTSAEVIAAVRTGDPVLADAAEAAARAGQDGQLAQYLAGVPDLINRLQGPGDPYGQAIIMAAMDAARLGCQDPLPEALLLDAAPGYLDRQERTIDTGHWAGPALIWATARLKGVVQAVEPIAPSHGTGIVGYRPADYLDQHGRRTRQHQIGPAELWNALAAHTTGIADLQRLGSAARDYGLYRFCAVFSTKAAAQGNASAAYSLIGLLQRASPGCVRGAGRWSAAHASLDNPAQVAFLLQALQEAGASDAVTALLARAPAAHANVDDAIEIAPMVYALHDFGASDAITALASRAAAHAGLNNPVHVALLLIALHSVGASDGVTTLASRAAAHVSLDNPEGLGTLLHFLDLAGASDAVTALLARDPAAHASLDNPGDVASLLNALREAGAADAVMALLARDPAAHASLEHPGNIASLLNKLDEAGASDAVTALASRAAAHFSLSNPMYVSGMLGVLDEAGASDAVTALASRAAAHVSTDKPEGVARLLAALRKAGAADAVTALASRASTAGIPSAFLKHPDGTVWQGREPDGTPAQPWIWQEPSSQEPGILSSPG